MCAHQHRAAMRDLDMRVCGLRLCKFPSAKTLSEGEENSTEREHVVYHLSSLVRARLHCQLTTCSDYKLQWASNLLSRLLLLRPSWKDHVQMAMSVHEAMLGAARTMIMHCDVAQPSLRKHLYFSTWDLP